MSNFMFVPSPISTFVPTDVAGLTGWYKADGDNFQDSARTVAVASDADPVGSFTDYSGGSRHFISSLTERPLYKTGIQNGKPGLLFDGSNDKLTCATALSNFIANNAYTVFVAFKATAISHANATVYQNPGLFVDGVGGYFGLYLKSTPTVNIYNWDGSADVASTAITTSTSYATMARHESGSLYSSVNAGSETSATSGNTTALTGTMFMGVDRLGTTYWFQGYIYEIFCYNVALTTQQISDAYGYLRSKYSLY